MVNTGARSRRPYGHVDAKWAAGPVVVGVPSLTLPLLGLVRLTAWQPAVDIAGTLPGVAFSAWLSARMPAQVVRLPPTHGAGILGTTGYLLSTVLPQVMPTLARTYLAVLAIGLGLMLLAVLGNLASRLGRSGSQGDED
jgi:hypothetical protein